jgi:hypothetical protein
MSNDFIVGAPDAAPAGEPEAYLSKDGMRAIPAAEFDAYMEVDPKGMAEYIREKYTVPLFRAPPAGGEADERARFETWARERYAVTEHSFVRAPDGYAHTIGHRALGMTYASVQMLWEAWRDRAALQSPSAAQGPTARMGATPAEHLVDAQRARNLTTGRLHTRIEDIYADVEYLTGEAGVFTHMLPNAFRALQPYLREVVTEPRFWDGEYDTSHTGSVSLPPMNDEQRREFWKRYAASGSGEQEERK